MGAALPGVGPAGWLLGVDFGTSNTAAGHTDALSGAVLTLPLSPYGNLMPSAAYVHASGLIDVGDVARAEAVGDPRGFIAAPKRLLALGQTTFQVGEWDVPAQAVVAAALRAALTRAQEQHHGQTPAGLVLTHPQGWASHQIRVLIDAATELGCPPHLVRTVSEPLAAAQYYADRSPIDAGERVAVFDFGGGALNVAVLVASGNGAFEVTAAQGDNTLGGDNFDATIHRWVDERLSSRNPALATLLQDESTTPEQRAVDESIRQAKETLSDTESADIDAAAGEFHEALQLTRPEFEELIGREVERGVQLAQATFRAANVDGADLRAIYLTGGSSRVPLVQRRIRALGPVTTVDDPTTVLARGALIAVRGGRTPAVTPQFPTHSPFPPPLPFPAPPPFPTPEPQPVQPLFGAPAHYPVADRGPQPAYPTPELFSPPQHSTTEQYGTPDPYSAIDPLRPVAEAVESGSGPMPLFPGPPNVRLGFDDRADWQRWGNPEPEPTPVRVTPWRSILATVSALAVIGGAVAVAMLGSHKPTPAPAPAARPSAPAAVSISSTTGVSTTETNTSCTGMAGPGVTDTAGGRGAPIDVVNALEYAYYVQRDPAAVTALYAPNTLTDDAKQTIATWIGRIPAGTTYCVTADVGADPFTVNYDITENRPGTAPNRYRMFLKVGPAAPYAIVSVGTQG